MNFCTYSHAEMFKIARQASCFILCFLYASVVFANPVGGEVAQGSAVITNTPNTTTIQQTSDKAIINWQSFNIDAHETTHFQQPTGGVALNRINPNMGASQIFG